MVQLALVVLAAVAVWYFVMLCSKSKRGDATVASGSPAPGATSLFSPIWLCLEHIAIFVAAKSA